MIKEETEVKKDIEWLKKEIEEDIESWGGGNPDYFRGASDAYENVKDWLNQLDEPEVLTQELPVIPKFVAEFLIGKEDYMLYELLDDEWLYKEHDRVAKWLYDNDELTNKQREIDLVMARDRGYVVEEEQKYILSINITDKASKTNYETFLNKRGIFHSMENEFFNSEEFSWTEEEIKDLESGEILFEHFATKIEELEE